MVSIEIIYNNLVNIRNLEIEYFWQRNVFLFGIQGVILSFFIGSFNSFINNNFGAILAVTAIFGFLFAILIFIIIYQSKMWVDYWEKKCKNFEDIYKLEFRLFDKHFESNKVFSKYFSTKLLIVSMSGLFILFWGVIIIYLYQILF